MSRPFGYGPAPAGWRSTQLRTFLTRRRQAGRPNLPLLSVNLPLGVVPRADGDGRPAPAEDLSKYQHVRVDDLVMNQLGKPHGAIGVSAYEGIISPAYFVAAVGPTADARFVHHLLRTRLYISEYERRGKFMPPSQFDISWEQFRSIEVLLPPMRTQQAIADYLDTETARIECLIDKKQALLKVLDERINAMVSLTIGDSALAEGTRPTREIRNLLTKVRRPGTEGQIVTAFRDGQVTARVLRRAEGYTEASTGNTAFQGVRRCDVVVHGLDGFAGAVGTSEADGICSPVYHVMTPQDGGDANFYGRLLHVLATTGYLGLFAVSTRERAVDFRTWDLFGRIPIPEVSIDVQREIGERIRALRPLRAAIKRSEAIALERRQTLITAVVTGELEIPGAAP